MKSFGFQEPVIVPEDYSFGSIGGDVLQESGSWMDYLPEFEHQRKSTDTQGCVSFGTLSALEMLHKRLYGVEPNYSDRFTVKLSGTTRTGNNPKSVIQSIRHDGTVKEEVWPFSKEMSWNDYFAFIPSKLIKLGAKWLSEYKVGYEYVNGNEKELKKALKYSPIGVSVYAWNKNSDGVYEEGFPNHWCVLVRYNFENQPVIWDSYEEQLKVLVKGYRFKYCMRYTIEKRSERRNWFIDLFIRLFT